MIPTKPGVSRWELQLCPCRGGHTFPPSQLWFFQAVLQVLSPPTRPAHPSAVSHVSRDVQARGHQRQDTAQCGKCLNSHCKEALAHTRWLWQGSNARVALSSFPKLTPPPVPVPSRLAGVEIPGMLDRDSGHCHRVGTGTPRNAIPVPRCSPGLCRGLCTLLSCGAGRFPAARAAGGALSALISIFWVGFLLHRHPLGSCRGPPAPHQRSRARSLSHSTAWLCPSPPRGLCCPPSTHTGWQESSWTPARSLLSFLQSLSPAPGSQQHWAAGSDLNPPKAAAGCEFPQGTPIPAHPGLLHKNLQPVWD